MSLSNEEKIAKYKKEVDDFAYIVSHDISAPLRAVFGSVSIIESKLKEHISDEDKQLFENINKGRERFTKMMKEVNDYGKLSTSHNLSDTNIDILSIIEKAKSAKTNGIIAANAEVSISGSLANGKGDPEQLYYIFWELIDNALKYSSPERQPIIKIHAQSTEASNLISVEDNGIGISHNFFDKIFQIFQKLHHEKDYSGSGIGLSYAKKIADIHGGCLTVESNGNSWTKFILNLPH